jgi:hypothetical protein
MMKRFRIGPDYTDAITADLTNARQNNILHCNITGIQTSFMRAVSFRNNLF